jgi:hypothetical protein
LDELITHHPPNLFIPLMANYDPKLGGSIETLQVDEGFFWKKQRRKYWKSPILLIEKNPPNWRGLISRATMLVQNDFGIADFQAIRLIIVTFMERIALRNNAIDGKVRRNIHSHYAIYDFSQIISKLFWSKADRPPFKEANNRI